MTTTTNTARFVTFHALQAFPPSLLNRDDSNSTKQIVFGDTPRVRVSAQSLRRAIRNEMRQHRIADGHYGMRTVRFPALTAAVLAERHGHPADIATAKTAAVFRKLNLKATEKGNTAVQVFASESFPDSLADLINAAWNEIGDEVPDHTLAAARSALDVGRAIDLALFGRMLAEIPDGGRIDGAVGVAHAFSVDAAAIEPDYWTAVDDAAPDGEPASTNLGTAMVSAPVLYRQASLDRGHLRHTFSAANPDTAEQLSTDAERSFVEWFIRAVPSAKQRSSVAHTLPSIVVATLGTQVLSAANAFTRPVTGEVLTEATGRLLTTLQRGTEAIGTGEHVILVTDPALDPAVAAHTPTHTIAEFIDQILAR